MGKGDTDGDWGFGKGTLYFTFTIHFFIYIYIYIYRMSIWTQLGLDIDGEATGDYSGWSVSMSDDGQTVAIGALFNDAGGASTDNRGHVRVFKYDVNKTTNVTDQNSADFGPVGWRRLGQDIDGEAANDYSGISVSISADGQTVAIGATGNDGTPTLNDRGHVRVYKYDVNKTANVTDESSPDFGPVGWRRLGIDIDGEAANDLSGRSVSISADGQTVAIGANNNDAGNASTDNRGHVRVFNLYTPPTTYITGGNTYTYTLDVSNNATITAFTPTNRSGALSIVGTVIDDSSTSFTVTAIGASAFLNCNLLTSITIPASITDIGASAFSGSTSLADITISGSTIPTVGTDAFLNINPTFNVSFNDLTYVKGASANSVIGNNISMAGATPTMLQTIPLFDTINVTEIGANAFQNYTGITSTIIPASITSIGAFAFSGATSLATIRILGTTVPDSSSNSFANIKVPPFDVIFYNIIYRVILYNMSVIYGDTPTNGDIIIFTTVPLFSEIQVTTVGENAFTGYTNITSISLPDTITEIGSGAFDGTSSLTSLIIPDSVTTIDTTAFSNSGIVTIYTSDASQLVLTPDASGNVFGIPSANLTLVSSYDYNINDGGRLTYTLDGSNNASIIKFDPIIYSNNLLNLNVDINNTYPIVSIKDYVFAGIRGFRNITLPNSLTYVGPIAFDASSNLSNVYFNNSIDISGVTHTTGNPITLGEKTNLPTSSYSSYIDRGATFHYSLNPSNEATIFGFSPLSYVGVLPDIGTITV